MLRDIPFNRMKGISFFIQKGGLIMNEIAEKGELAKDVTKHCLIDN